MFIIILKYLEQTLISLIYSWLNALKTVIYLTLLSDVSHASKPKIFFCIAFGFSGVFGKILRENILWFRDCTYIICFMFFNVSFLVILHILQFFLLANSPSKNKKIKHNKIRNKESITILTSWREETYNIQWVILKKKHSKIMITKLLGVLFDEFVNLFMYIRFW